MARLHLGLLEKDLADCFNIAQQEVSDIFATWIDPMSDCLGQLGFTTERDTMKRNLPKCFKKIVIFSLAVTTDASRVFIHIFCSESNI